MCNGPLGLHKYKKMDMMHEIACMHVKMHM